MKLKIKKREDENLKEGIFDIFKKKPQQTTQSPSYADVAQKTRQKMQQKMQNKDYQDVVSQVSDRKKELEKRQELAGMTPGQQMKSQNPEFYSNVLGKIAPLFNVNSSQEVEQKLQSIINTLSNSPGIQNRYRRMGVEYPRDNFSTNMDGTPKNVIDIGQQLVSIASEYLKNGNFANMLPEDKQRTLQQILNRMITNDINRKLEQVEKLKKWNIYDNEAAYADTGEMGGNQNPTRNLRESKKIKLKYVKR